MNAIASTKPRHTDMDSGALDKRTVRAGLTPKMIHAMITGMVKDKNAYPIREIGKNCHEVSPKDKPWTLRLPDYMSNMAVFRNFGPPLSHHFMMNRYPKMGDSTKDKLGVNGLSGLGLGSKSPFAKLLEDGQSGSYNVTSYDKGEARFYLISLTTDGQIQVKLMGRGETTEHDGLEVSFAVPERDHSAFNQAAHEVLWGFEPRPIVTPRNENRFTPARVRERGPNWTRYDGGSVPWYGVMVRVENCIMYPVDLDQIEGSEDVLQANDYIVFDVGAHDIQATSSREALQYTAQTRDTLKAIVDRYADAIVEVAVKAIADAPTYWEACWELAKAKEGKTSGIRDRINKAASWRDRRLDERLNWGWTKAMFMRGGWDEFEKFSGINVNARDMIGAKIVVQHGTDRTQERLEAHGLVGKPFLFVRMKRPDLETFKKSFSVPDSEVTVLESIKLPPRERAAPGTRPPKMRKLDVFTTGMQTNENRISINVSEPMPFVVRRAKPSRRGKNRWSSLHGWALPGNVWVEEGHFDALMAAAVKAGVIKSGEAVACFRNSSDVPEGWDHDTFDFGAHLVAEVKRFYDPAQTRSAKLGNWYNVSRTLQTIVNGDSLRGITLPDDLQLIAAEGKNLKDNGAASVEPGIHDVVKDALELCRQIDKVELPTLYKIFEDKYDALVASKYKVLDYILEDMYYDAAEHKGALQHYFDLLVKAGIN